VGAFPRELFGTKFRGGISGGNSGEFFGYLSREMSGRNCPRSAQHNLSQRNKDRQTAFDRLYYYLGQLS